MNDPEPKPLTALPGHLPKVTRPLRFYSRRIWEPVTMAAMFAGFVMLLQPFLLALYTASFGVILFGVLGFMVASKLPE